MPYVAGPWKTSAAIFDELFTECSDKNRSLSDTP